ncbi:hypothetical protein JL720_5943 [Aureococcus anophagefferens]|nr:hypothetical protein JL720_5943 [Aureococcus anophagefferens]
MRCGVATVVVAAAAAAWFSQPRRADELLLLLRNASADSLPSSASAAVALLPNASAAVALLRPNASAAFSFASSASATLGLPSDASTAFKRLSDASATLGLPSNAGGVQTVGPPSPELALCRKWWPVGALAGRDRDGAPVDYHRLGAADLPGVEREVGRAAFLEFVAVLNEECFAGFRAASTDGAVHASGSVIMDMDGLGLRHLRAIPGALAALRLAEPNYPERQRIFIVRAPPAFHAVYRALRPALNAGSATSSAAPATRPTSRGRPVPVGELAFHRGFRSGAQLETPLGGAGGARDVEPPPETPKKPKKPKTPRARR